MSSVRGLTGMVATEGILFMARCNADKRAQALQTISLHDANTVDAQRKECEKSREKLNGGFLCDRKALEVGILLSRAK